MLSVLKESKWQFQFKLEVLSPRGFRYAAEGASGEEAFLKAFGQWQKDLVAYEPTPEPERPKQLPPRPALLPKEPKQHLSKVVKELLERYGSSVGQPGYRIMPRHLGIPADSKDYRRLYMRAYRARKRALEITV